MLRTITVAALAAGIMIAGSAVAQTPRPSTSPIVVIVDVPVPAGVPRERILAGMEASIPQYQSIPGLIRKYFTLSESGEFGGVYLWRGRTEADAWFNDAWRQRVLATYGAAPKVTYYEAPIVTEGSAASSPHR